jgi:two-component system, OmpR family, alkaline phosphatase synthesis response regulator PhoP
MESLQLRPPIVLLVDSEPDMLTNYVRLLRPEGYRCLTAGTGRDALAHIDWEHPDVVTTELNLPDLDGLVVTRHARRCTPPIPVLVVTAYVSRATPDAIYDAGAGLYLPKPFVNRTFVEAVRRALGERP